VAFDYANLNGIQLIKVNLSSSSFCFALGGAGIEIRSGTLTNAAISADLSESLIGRPNTSRTRPCA
jgi:hypothetical protein